MQSKARLFNRRQLLKRTAAFAALATCMPMVGCAPEAANLPAKLRLATSIYVGWVPWMAAAQTGILKKAASAAGLEIELVRGDYAETIDQFIAGHVDAITITNIDALAAFAESKLAADIVLIGSFSNGNDAIVVPQGQTTLVDGLDVGMVRNSVSEYVLDRYLETAKIDLATVKRIDISDADMARSFVGAGESLGGVVTWNPIVDSLEKRAAGVRIFDSSKIPREIADCLVIRRTAMDAHPNFAKALLQAWFAIMAELGGANREQTLATFAQLSGASVPEYLVQLESTELLDTRAKALAALNDKTLTATMERAAEFAQRHGLAKTDRASWHSVGADSRGVLRINPAPLALLV